MLKYQSDGVTGLNQPKQTLSQVSSISLDPTIHAQVRIILQVVQLLRIKQATYYFAGGGDIATSRLLPELSMNKQLNRDAYTSILI